MTASERLVRKEDLVFKVYRDDEKFGELRVSRGAIVWRGRIIWCDRYERDNVEPSYDAGLEERLYRVLALDGFRYVEDLATQLDEIPWEVSRAARRLIQRGFVEADAGPKRDWFRRRQNKA